MTNKASRVTIISLILLFLSTMSATSQEKVDFDSPLWEKKGKVVEHLGRKAFAGHAELKDVVFQDGTIEVDVAVTGGRSYPGFYFRIQDGKNNERVYIRAHKNGLYPDAIQYTPTFKRVAGWQLYHGNGCTAPMFIDVNKWVTLKLVVKANKAQLFIDGNEKPALEISELQHGISKGAIGIDGPANGSAYFSNFRYQHAEPSKVIPTAAEREAGVKWQISRLFPAAKIGLKELKYPRFYAIKFGQWQDAYADEKGMLDISRYIERKGPGADLVFVRTIFSSDEKKTIAFPFGYSDEVVIFMNKKKVFYGNSAYRSRDGSFAGLIGLNDHVYLDVNEGLNEIFFVVKESFGGWGIMSDPTIEFDPPEVDLTRAKILWETPATMKTPESVLYDKKRKVFYVSSFDVNYKPAAKDESEYTGFITRINLDGKIEELRWIDKLHAPCGMDIYDDKLYVVERGKLTEIDIDHREVLNRYPVAGSEFLNDLIIDDQGYIYMSDTSPSNHRKSRIYRFRNGKTELWLDSDKIFQANGLFIHEGKLIVGNSGDGVLRAVDLKTRKIDDLISLGVGVQDGIRVDDQGNWLLSHWEGNVFSVDDQGKVVKIIDTFNSPDNTADLIAGINDCAQVTLQ